MFRSVLLLLLGLTGLGFCQGAFEDISRTGSLLESRSSLEGIENLRRKVQAKQLVGPRGSGPKGSHPEGKRLLDTKTSKGSKKISKNGSKKKNGEEYEFFFMIVRSNQS